MGLLTKMEVEPALVTEEEKPLGVGRQLGFPCSPFQSGSRFKGFQQSKGNKYQVEVIIQVLYYMYILCYRTTLSLYSI